MNEEKQWQLEDYVNAVDYAHINDGYVPSPEAIEFLTFIKLVNGVKGEENKSPPMHLKMIDALIHQNDNLFVVHRGGAKTTVIHEYAYLYLAVYGGWFGFGKVDVAIYVSDTMENGVKNMREQLQFRWEDSEFLQKYISKIKFTEDRWEFTRVDGGKFFCKGFAAMTGVRGFKQYGQRPVWCGFDDLLSDKNSKSPTIIADIESVIYKAANEALHPSRRKMHWTGTPFNKKDPLYKAAGSGGWNVQVYPIAEKFPCTRQDFRGSWPDRFTYDSTKQNFDKKLLNGQIRAFNQELMLRITSDEDRLILDCDINWYSRATLLTNKAKYNFYITTDFATSEKESADYSVISVWAINNKGFWFLVDGVCKRQRMNQNLKDLFRLAQEYNPMSVGVEVSGQQGGFIDMIQARMMEHNQWFTLASDNNNNSLGIRPNGKKLTRFMTIEPWFKAGRFYFPSEWKHTHELVVEMIDEISNITPEGYKSAHDDAGDTIAMLSVMNGVKPTHVSAMTVDKSGLWEVDDDDNDSSNALNSYVV